MKYCSEPPHFSPINLQPGEEMQPENVEGPGGGEEADELLVAQLVSMGFPESKCKRAALSTGNKGRNLVVFFIFMYSMM